MTAKEQVLKKHRDAVMVRVRGLKLYIVECDNRMGWRTGLGYGTTQTGAWQSAANQLKSKENDTKSNT